MALVSDEAGDMAAKRHVHVVPQAHAGGISLLRLSVPARLAIVALASALLWGAVLWALV